MSSLSAYLREYEILLTLLKAFAFLTTAVPVWWSGINTAPQELTRFIQGDKNEYPVSGGIT
jgi:hypothetical protein